MTGIDRGLDQIGSPIGILLCSNGQVRSEKTDTDGMVVIEWVLKGGSADGRSRRARRNSLLTWIHQGNEPLAQSVVIKNIYLLRVCLRKGDLIRRDLIIDILPGFGVRFDLPR